MYDLLDIPMNRKHLYSGASVTPCLQHRTPAELRAGNRPLIPKHVWDDYYKITVVRNPFDRLVSDFNYLRTRLRRGKQQLTFDSFVRLACRVVRERSYRKNVYFDHFRPQSEYVTPDANFDRVCRFETLNSDIEEFKRDVGIPVDKTLPWKNRTSRMGSTDDDASAPATYRKYYTDVLREMVAQTYAADLHQFNYSF